jgi:hypothetical protein
VNNEHYLSMLCNTFVPHLLATGLPLQTQWFMQEWIQATHSEYCFGLRHDIFDSHVVSNRFSDHFACGQNWPPNSPDLNPCDYFLWGFLKEKIFLKKPQTVIKLRGLIIQTCNLLSSNWQHHSSCWRSCQT